MRRASRCGGLRGVDVPIYGPAKSVADCFKFRNKIGVDVAIEALRECLDEGRCSVDELDRYARICRVSRVMRPYLEAPGVNGSANLAASVRARAAQPRPPPVARTSTTC